MDISTFCVETPTNCGVRRQLTGKLVCSDGESRIYHTRYDDDADIRAIIDKNSYSEVLKRDGSVQECKIISDIPWTHEYEIFLYCVDISNSNDTYICSEGFISRGICVKNSNSVEINIQNTPVRVVLERDHRSYWKVKRVIGTDRSMRSDIYDRKISEDFTPHSQVARIGIDNKTPESLEVIYDSEN